MSEPGAKKYSIQSLGFSRELFQEAGGLICLLPTHLTVASYLTYEIEYSVPCVWTLSRCRTSSCYDPELSEVTKLNVTCSVTVEDVYFWILHGVAPSTGLI